MDVPKRYHCISGLLVCYFATISPEGGILVKGEICLPESNNQHAACKASHLQISFDMDFKKCGGQKHHVGLKRVKDLRKAV